MRAGRWVRAGLVLLAVAEALLLGVATWAGAPVLLALGQVVLLPLAGLLVLARRYLTLRSSYRSEQERDRRESDRRQLADDVHDLVGHELSLIAMQAGLLELRTSGQDAEIAASLRDRAEAAVHNLHDTVTVIAEETTLVPATTDIEQIVQRSRESGAEVVLEGTAPSCTALSRTLAAQVVREGLTNAARHAPGGRVVVRVNQAGDDVEVTVTTVSAILLPRAVPAGRGLEAMERRLQSVGGALAISLGPRRHVLTARIPRQVMGHEPRRVDVSVTRTRRRAAVQVLVPLAAIVTAVLAFYWWGSHGATIDPLAEARLHRGMTTSHADALLPRREAPVRLVTPPAHPSAWACRSFTNGNFPLAVATTEVCSSGGVVVRITDLAARPPW